MKYIVIIVLLSLASLAHGSERSGWLQVGASLQTAEQYEAERKIRYEFTGKVERCFTEVSPDTRFVVGIYSNADGEVRFPEYNGTVLPTIPKDWYTLVLYGEESAATGDLPTPFAGVGNRIYVPAVAMNHTWFCAGLTYALHESKHRAQQGNGEASSALEARSAILGHEAARNYIAAVTRQRYIEMLQQVVTEWRPVFQFEDVEETRALKALFPQALSAVEDEVRQRQIFADLTLLRLEQDRCNTPRNGCVGEEEKIAVFLLEMYASM